MKSFQFFASAFLTILVLCSCATSPETQSFLVAEGVLQYYLPAMEAKADSCGLSFDITYRDTKADDAQAVLNFSLVYPKGERYQVVAQYLEPMNGDRLGPFPNKLMYRESDSHTIRYTMLIPRARFLELVSTGLRSITLDLGNNRTITFPVGPQFEKRIASVREDILN